MKNVILYGSVAVLVVGMSLACAGLGIGPGQPIGQLAVSSTAPQTLSVTAPADEDVGLWLTFDVDHTGPWAIDGTLEVQHNGQLVRSEQVHATDSGSPIVGGAGRVEWGSSSASFNGRGSSSASLYLLEVPGVAGARRDAGAHGRHDGESADAGVHPVGRYFGATLISGT